MNKLLPVIFPGRSFLLFMDTYMRHGSGIYCGDIERETEGIEFCTARTFQNYRERMDIK